MTKRELYRIIIRLNFSRDGGIAQLARAFGSYPKCRRFESYFRYQRPGGQAVKTPPFHGGNTSSILVRVTIAPLTFVRGVIHILRRCGGIGRHKGLKIPRTNTPYRFKSGRRHQKRQFSNCLFSLPKFLKMPENGLYTGAFALSTIKLSLIGNA